MHINTANPGDRFEITGRDEKTNQPVTTKFEIVEISWFPSPIKHGVFYHGATVKTEDGTEAVLDFITLECSQKL
jgi:hypothetical protein